MRAFVAIDLPGELRGEVAAVSRTLAHACKGRFVPYENLHLTLAFLGEVDEAEAAAAVASLEEACRDMGPVTLAPAGLGKFGRSSDATLWLGIEETPQLVALAARVREALTTHGVPFDEKPFRAHVTLARRVRLIKGPLPSLPFPLAAEADRVTLYRSLLDRSGATYKPLYTMEL